MTIFTLTMGQIIICNVKGVTHGDPGRISPAVPLRSTERFSILQLIVLVLQPSNVVFSSLQPLSSTLFPAVVEEVFRSFTYAKVATPHCENTPLQVKVLHSEPYLCKSM